jgi:predicted RNase H-like HicB family nuclease
VRRYVVLKADEHEPGYTVEVPSLPGCITEGDTVEEALNMAREAITVYVEDLLAHGEVVPDADPPPVPASNEFVTVVEINLEPSAVSS